MPPGVAIVDYGMGNIFSVKQACEYVGLKAYLTSEAKEIVSADAVILPGVGAFSDAMIALRQLDLLGPLKEAAFSNKPFLAICLGLQLLMTRSYEFGQHEGLDIIEGDVVRLESERNDFCSLKVPQVGWNRILYYNPNVSRDPLLASLRSGDYMYFVHSYYVRPKNRDLILTLTHYGKTEFCSSLRWTNIFAYQFHPERSGKNGLQIYKNFCDFIKTPV